MVAQRVTRGKRTFYSYVCKFVYLFVSFLVCLCICVFVSMSDGFPSVCLCMFVYLFVRLIVCLVSCVSVGRP